jgi:hypothetical protein
MNDYNIFIIEQNEINNKLNKKYNDIIHDLNILKTLFKDQDIQLSNNSIKNIIKDNEELHIKINNSIRNIMYEIKESNIDTSNIFHKNLIKNIKDQEIINSDLKKNLEEQDRKIKELYNNIYYLFIGIFISILL